MNPGARYRGPWTGALDRIKVWDRSLVCCSVQYVLVSWRVGHRPSTAPGQRDSDCVCVCTVGGMGHTTSLCRHRIHATVPQS